VFSVKLKQLATKNLVGKENVKLFLCLIKHHDTKTYWGVRV